MILTRGKLKEMFRSSSQAATRAAPIYHIWCSHEKLEEGGRNIFLCVKQGFTRWESNPCLPFQQQVLNPLDRWLVDCFIFCKSFTKSSR